jgi:hypothetical protein
VRRRRDSTNELTTVGFFRWDVRQRCAPGHLDRIDLVDSTTSQHCDVCEHRWQTYDRGSATPRLA